ncbi:YeeE/YedE family protein [Methyloprofundus sedimenti]|uniref:YeeE/YedE family protein n=1 Tax=Methyloprofundus sedimenti TaxID=1420851 RepID=UPI001E3AE59C|nr:YeeE/YedE family protein [Methyloprofundus sedimenti]
MGKSLENFTPVSALSGGALIGLSVSLLLLFNGRMAGISGIMNGMFSAPKKEEIWRGLFLMGLILGAFIFQLLTNNSLQLRLGYPILLIILGGFLVGFGTRMGNGCTSGHGICGIATFSLRSIAATITFMLSGMITVFILKHLLGVA